MWVFSAAGAASIVRKGKPGEFQVRARVQRDLANLLVLAGLPADRIITTPNADYAFRAAINRDELGRLMAALALAPTNGGSYLPTTRFGIFFRSSNRGLPTAVLAGDQERPTILLIRTNKTHKNRTP